MATRTLPVPGGSVDLRTGAGTGPVGPFQLTDTELALLQYLSARPGRVVDKQELLGAVWGYHANVVSRAVDTAVRRLRAKMADGERGPQQIRTSRGEGYSFHPWVEGGRPPRPPRRLWGRDDWLDRVRAAFDEGVVALVGPPGVGKTALAAQIARTSPHPVAWVDGRACADADALEQALASALRLSDADQLAGTLARWVEPQLLVLDAMDDLDEDGWRWLDRLDAPRMHVLITAVRSLAPTPVTLRLPPLDAGAGADMFRARAPVPRPEELDPDAVAAAVDLVGALPLGIEVAAATLSRVPLPTLVEQLRAAVPPSLQQVLGAQLAGLPARARWAVLHLLVFRGSFALDAAAAVLDVELATLEELVDDSLIAPDRAHGRHRVPSPVALLLGPAWSESPDRPAVVARHRAYFGEIAASWASGPLDPEDVADDLADVRGAASVGPPDDTHARLLLGLHAAWGAGAAGPPDLADGAPDARPELQVQLLAAHAEVLGVSRPYREAAVAFSRAAELAGAHGLQAQSVAMQLRRCRLALASRPDPEARSWVERARTELAALPPSPQRDALAAELGLVDATVAVHDGDVVRAREGFARVVAEALPLGEAALASAAEEYLARIATMAGERAEGIRHLEDAVRHLERVGRRVEALLRREGKVSLLLPDVERAATTEAEVEALERDCLAAGMLGLYASVRMSHGILRLNAQDHEAAGALLLDAHELLVATSRPNLAAVAEGARGLLAHDRGHLLEALGFYARAIAQRVRGGGQWEVLAWLVRRQQYPNDPGPAPVPSDARSAAVARACADPAARPRDPLFYDISWWPVLDRILDRAWRGADTT